MPRARVLVQLDSDREPSLFDSVVAVDAGVDHLFRYSQVEPEGVRDLVYGAIFTRGPADLKHTAIFIGGSDVARGEQILERVRETFFGPFRVSVMLDPSGANTTAAACVLEAAEGLELASTTTLVLAGTGAVGRRVAALVARAGSRVRVASRTRERSAAVCQDIAARVPGAQLEPVETSTPAALAQALEGVALLVAAGPPGVELLSGSLHEACPTLKLAVDLSAVPPYGLAQISPQDHGVLHEGVRCFGALAIGGRKMKIHKAAVASLFTASDKIVDLEQLYELGRQPQP